VNRQDIVEGAEALGVPLDDHIDFCIKSMQAKADELGIKGSL
jgi:predicted hydrolase (HD superfamily)